MYENMLFNERYLLERLLGRGSFAEVWLARDTKTESEVALKIYVPATGLDEEGLKVFAREFTLVMNVHHKNLLTPLYYDTCNRVPYLVLPFCREGNTMQQLGKMTEGEAWRFIRDIAAGLSYLHSLDPPIIHQDIKPDNIMIGEDGSYMITDFGISAHVRSTLRKSTSTAYVSAGTIAYMAPERFGKDNTPIKASDVYSLGATVYELITGTSPFGDDGGLLQKKGAEIPEMKGAFSADLKHVITACLSFYAWDRPTAAQLEQYARTALDGKKIHFESRAPFWQRHKTPLLAALLVVLLATAGILCYRLAGVTGEASAGMSGNAPATGRTPSGKVKPAARQVPKAVATADTAALDKASEPSIPVVHAASPQSGPNATMASSAASAAKAHIAAADRLKRQGDRHEENFEVPYIEAYTHYRQADDLVRRQHLHDVVGSGYKTRMEEVRRDLAKAYQTFKEKEAYFLGTGGDADLAKTFERRSARIRQTIGL